jgi:hypothetical protein
MNNEFQEKLHLYKEGKLNQDEITEIEYEIDKFNALWDFLNNEDKEFLEELKQQIPVDNREENKLAKLLKRRVNLRIIILTAISIFSVLIVTIFLYFTASNIVSSLFGLNYKELYVKRATVVQIAQMFHPQYESNRSGTGTSLFAQQNILVSLDNTVGNTRIDETEISVKYSFGRPVPSKTPAEIPPFLEIHDFSLLTNHEADPTSGFKVLENAPQGTKVKVFIEFSKALTPEQLKENFINQINTVDTTPLVFTPIVAVDSKFLLANPSYFRFTPTFPYDNKNEKQVEDNRLKQNQYENMDNQAHKESLIGNLKLINNNQRLLQAMYNVPMLQDVNVDDMIKHVENNGVEYFGMYISVDREELLKLRDNSLIHCMGVENIVVW